ncbi:MAG: energy transducer TonB [Mucilaginibacter sp.]|nr:energy transducer TonB [Mucilaginibacter sp.]
MKKTLLITLLFLVSVSLKAQNKSVDAPDLDKLNIKELDIPTKDLTFDPKNTDNKETLYTSVDVEPHFQGGITNFYNYLQQNIGYPKRALIQRVQGKVFVGFVVEKDGSLTNIKILRSVSPEIDAEAGRAISNSPNWFPALLNGLQVRAQYVVPITFKLPPENIIKQQLLMDSLRNLPPDRKIFTAVEQEPTFPGGIEKFYNFLQSNIRYPVAAFKNKVQGRVFISFIVERDGSLSDVRVVRGIGSGCDEEAARVISISPRWKSGIQNGRPVRVAYTIPVSFDLM